MAKQINLAVKCVTMPRVDTLGIERYNTETISELILKG